MNKKKLFCLVILWEGNPNPKLSSFQCRNSHQSVVFTRGCHRVAFEGVWNDWFRRFPSGEQYPTRIGSPFWPRYQRRWKGTSGHAAAHSTAFLWASSALVLFFAAVTLPSDPQSNRSEASNFSPLHQDAAETNKRNELCVLGRDLLASCRLFLYHRNLKTYWPRHSGCLFLFCSIARR